MEKRSEGERKGRKKVEIYEYGKNQKLRLKKVEKH